MLLAVLANLKQKDFPQDVIPERVDPPYDRDSKLPQAPEPSIQRFLAAVG
jgi:hypothetical protein